MKSINVKRTDLLDILKKNRENHRDIFEKAQDIYREQAIQELDRMLSDAKANKKIRRFVMLPEPEDHTEDYDRAISMMEMSVDDIIELVETDHSQYVMDNWGWQKSFATNTSSYLAANIR